MDIFWRLVLAHLLADFTFQTDFIAKWKRESIFGGLIHSFIFFVCASLLCFARLHELARAAWIGKDCPGLLLA